MDPNTTYSTPPTPPVIPPPPQPAVPLKTSRLSSFIYWLHTHKKLALTIICIIFLFGVLFFLSYASLKNLISPPKSPDSTGNQSAAQNRTSLILTTPKIKYSQSEKIIITAVADSQNQFITGFDVLINFDPEFLSLTDKKSPALPNFDYFGSNQNGLLQTSAVQKTSIKQPQVFKNQKLFEFEFTAKKSGKTQIGIVYMPNSTSDSNLINNDSQDILNNVKGVEITID
jgi:hypothetical protein